MSDNRIMLLGYSGHGYVVAEAAILAGLPLTNYAEKNKLALNPYDLEYSGFEQDEDFIGWGGNFKFILGIGDNAIRRKVANVVLAKGGEMINALHPGADLSQKATFGTGNFIARNVSVNPLATIGNYCILNTGCIIEHECKIADGVHIAPGAVLAGNVAIGENSFIGANSVIKQGVEIGSNVIVGAGSVVIKNVSSNAIVAGNPAKEIWKK